jgi:hypothetical protein
MGVFIYIYLTPYIPLSFRFYVPPSHPIGANAPFKHLLKQEFKGEAFEGGWKEEF